jgi:hypothetical protein
MHHLPRCFVLVGLLTISPVIIACSGGDDSADTVGAAGTATRPGGPGSGAPQTPPDFATLPEVPEDEAATALGTVCQTMLSCKCPSAATVTEADCEAWFITLTQQASTEPNGLTYDGACVADMVAAINYIQCAAPSQIEAWWALASAVPNLNCKMYYGSKQVGSQCTALVDSNGDDCDRNLVCEGSTCRTPPFSLAEDAACTAEDDCHLPAVCLPTSVTATDKRCVVLPAAGSDCYLGLLCEVGASCEGGKCVPLPAASEACSNNADVLERTCDPMAQCVSGQCSALPVADEDCSGACAPGFTCSAGTCKAEEPSLCEGGPFPLFPNTSG